MAGGGDRGGRGRSDRGGSLEGREVGKRKRGMRGEGTSPDQRVRLVEGRNEWRRESRPGKTRNGIKKETRK